MPGQCPAKNEVLLETEKPRITAATTRERSAEERFVTVPIRTKRLLRL